MKTKLLLLLLLANFTIHAQTNLVPNGNFETWTSSNQPNNWYPFFSGFVSQSTIAQNGKSSTNMMVANGTFTYINSEYFPIQANKTYRVTVYHKTVKGTFSSIDLSLYHKPGTFKEKITQKSDVTFSTTEWRKIEFEYTSKVSENIEVDIWTTGTLESEILVDNVSVIDIADDPVQYTLIPDVNFEKKLISLGIDSGEADGKVLTSNVSALTYLDLYDSSITNLTGIEDFVSLTNLNAQKNLLTKINLSKNINLEYLTVSENQLTDLDTKANILLTNLDCQRNILTDLDVSKNTQIIYLNVMFNKLSSLDLTTNLSLEHLTTSTNKLTVLDITNNIALTDINCGNNLLTSLDVTNNTLLIRLVCHQNQITSLNISKNKLLLELMCQYNKLTSIDVSNNPELYMLDCLNNQITSIDISKNPKITELACENNQLTYLNLKNGNNVNLELFFSNFINNPNLTCIQVDDITYSNTNWSTKKDATATYSTTCNTLGLEKSVFDKVVMYPNPTKGELHINNISLDKANVYNSLGQLVKTFTLNSSDINNTINLSNLPKGVYYVYLINRDNTSANKVIIE